MKILILDSITLGDDISLDKLKELGEVITYPQSSREEAKQRITEHNPEVIITNKVVIDEATWHNSCQCCGIFHTVCHSAYLCAVFLSA